MSLESSDTVLITRCPYCASSGEFKPMSAQNDRFVCDMCGHTEDPTEPGNRCLCPNCRRWKRRKPKSMPLPGVSEVVA